MNHHHMEMLRLRNAKIIRRPLVMHYDGRNLSCF